jgi:hypothetical protein
VCAVILADRGQRKHDERIVNELILQASGALVPVLDDL